MALVQYSIACLLVGSSLLATVAAGAQETTAPPPADDQGITEIIVTAQRRAEKLQTVPVAATVVTGEAWNKSASTGIEDLEKLSPSLTFDSTTSARNNSVRIRGIGTNTTSSAIEPQTSTVVDGVVLIRSGQSSAAQLLDIARIEVLRGPQGTLFGKNASAGVVNIVTNAPTQSLFLSGDILATDDEEYQLRATVSGPITPVLSARLSAYFRDFDGNSVNVANGRKLNAVNSLGARGKLLYDADEGFTAALTIDAGRTNSTCCARAIRELDAAGSTRVAIESPFLAPLRPGRENRDVNNDTPARDNSRSIIAGLELNKSFGEFTLTSITAYQHFEIDQQLDDDLTANAPIAGGQLFKQAITSNEKVNGYTQELRLTSPAWDSVDFVAGLWASKADVTQVSANIRRRTATPQNQISSFRSRTEFTNLAAFGQVNGHLTEKLTLLAGARLTWDKVVNDYARTDDPVAPFRSGNIAYRLEQTKTNLSGRVGAEYELSDAVFAYATFARGYKGPGFNVASNGTLADPPVKAELSDSYEIGTKLRLFDRRLSINLALFDAEYRNFAVTAIDPVTNSVRLINAGRLNTRGVELDIEARPARGLSITGALAYVDASIDVAALPCYDLQTAAQGCLNVTPTQRAQAIVGGRVPNSPNWKFGLNASYEWDATDSFDIILGAGVNYTGRQQLLLSQDPEGIIDSYTLVDASIGIASKDGRYRLDIFGKNLTDQFYANGLALVQDLTGSKAQFIPRDAARYFGVRLSARY